MDEVKLLPCEEMPVARRLAEEFVSLYTPGRCSFTDTIEEAFQWLQDRSIEPIEAARPTLVTDELVERVAPIVARALAKRHGLGDHMPADAWMKEAKVATRAVLGALAAMPTIDQDGGEA